MILLRKKKYSEWNLNELVWVKSVNLFVEDSCSKAAIFTDCRSDLNPGNVSSVSGNPAFLNTAWNLAQQKAYRVCFHNQ